MTDYTVANEATLRLSVFLFILTVMILAETAFPRKTRTMRRAHRWSSNILLTVIDGVFVRLLFPIIAVGAAVIASENQWGLFNLIERPLWSEVLLTILILDMLIYWQHVAFHRIPFLWAMHKVHHADRDIDVTTGFRFHPLEIALSMAYKIALIFLLGAPVLAVIIFEIILNGCAMFNHSNVELPLNFDKVVRRIIVTPDMHRVHHSTVPSETNSNYGFNLSLWDRLFGTYIAQPAKGHDDMVIGLEDYQTSGPNSLAWSLWLPIKAKKSLETWF